jgi:spore germination cell wall hydrolase CwlJ-like protein
VNPEYSFIMLALAIWREARGEVYAAKQGVAWVIQNRVLNPGWWGHDLVGVILMPFQFSSFNSGDPNATKFPAEADPSWADSLDVANKVIADALPDNTSGATSYFDNSIAPPGWATDGSQVHTVDIGNLHFYKVATT